MLAIVVVLLVGARDAGAAQLTASWTDNSSGGAAFTLERRTSDEATFTPLADVPIGVTSYVDAAITPGVTYCYRVKAYNDVVQSPYSNEACGSAPVDQPRDYSVSITKAGDGAGIVTSSPAGIDCGSGCTVSYPAGTLVTLTATPVAGSRFAGWSGECSGTGPCRVAGNRALALAATFRLLPSAATTAAPAATAGAPASTPPTSTAAMTGALPTSGALPSTPGSRSNNADPSLPSASSAVVTKAGDGAGTVSSSPTGIECGYGCTMTPTAGTYIADPTSRWSAPDPDRPRGRSPRTTATDNTTANARATGPRTSTVAIGPDQARPWLAAVQSATAGLGSPYRLMVRVARRTSIRVRMDNGQTYEEKLKPGAVRVWVSDQPFAITLPSTRGVRFELNGRRLPVPDGVAIADLVLPQPSAGRP